MNRRDKAGPPRPGMKWSERYGMWLDPDTRTAARKASDERIVHDIEGDQERMEAALKAAQEGGHTVVQAAAQTLEMGLLRSLVRARIARTFSQAEVARRMGVPQPAIVRLEAGTHSPTLMTLSRYAAAIGVRLQVSRSRIQRSYRSRPRPLRRLRVRGKRVRSRIR